MAPTRYDTDSSSDIKSNGYDEKGPLPRDNVSIHEGEEGSQLQRHLGMRQIQLIAVGGSIGTALFVSIGTGLARGGPVSLFLAYTIYSCFVAMVNNSMAEMCIYMPISSSFLRMAGRWVDDAFGFMAGWNFFFYEAFLIPFEISALNLIIKFWTDKVPVPAVCCACIILYGYVKLLFQSHCL
jgi:yeast amino acid transporter